MLNSYLVLRRSAYTQKNKKDVQSLDDDNYKSATINKVIYIGLPLRDDLQRQCDITYCIIFNERIPFRDYSLKTSRPPNHKPTDLQLLFN